LGYIVPREGARPDPRRVRAIGEYPSPRTVMEVRVFIGPVEYYGRHVRHFVDIAKPLAKLTRKDMPFEWGLEQQEVLID
jgi:hypothetical protein